MIIQNERGISLVEVLLAAAMMAFISLGVMQLTQNQQKSVKTIETKFEYISVFNNMRNILADGKSCFATFGNKTLTALTTANSVTALQQFSNTGNISHYPVDQKIANAFEIKYNVTYPTPKSGGIGFDPVDAEEGTINLEVVFDLGVNPTGENKTYSSRFITKKMRIGVSLSGPADEPGTSIVEACTAQGVMDDYVNVTGDEMTGHLTMQNGAEIIMESDLRLKENIKSIGPVLSRMTKLRPVSYNWINGNTDRDYGLIAQEVQAVFPELVHASEHLAVNYVQLTPILIQSVKELEAENRQLKNEMKEIRAHLCAKDKLLSICKKSR